MPPQDSEKSPSVKVIPKHALFEPVALLLLSLATVGTVCGKQRNQLDVFQPLGAIYGERGVAYGSDPRRVTQVLNEVAERHGLVEKDPKPQVLFAEFGDSTLMFELRIWVDVTKANAAQVSIDLRQMIAGSFAENGIVIAFPQRDIRLHPAHPIPVEVVTAASDGGEITKKSGRAEAGERVTKHEGLPEDNLAASRAERLQ